MRLCRLHLFVFMISRLRQTTTSLFLRLGLFLKWWCNNPHQHVSLPSVIVVGFCTCEVVKNVKKATEDGESCGIFQNRCEQVEKVTAYGCFVKRVCLLVSDWPHQTVFLQFVQHYCVVFCHRVIFVLLLVVCVKRQHSVLFSRAQPVWLFDRICTDCSVYIKM